MAQPLIKFYRSATAPTDAKVGSLWFDTTSSTINVLIAEAAGETAAVWEPYGGSEAVVIAEETAEKPNFLDMEENGLAVRSMSTAATTTTKAITVEGGPLANDITETGEEWPFDTVNGNRTIPAGTDIQTILEKLFLKEKWATPGTPTQATLTLSVTAPTPDFDAASKTGSLVEVGDTVDIGGIAANSVSVGGTTKTTVSGFTYGYSAADDNSKDSSNTSVSVSRETPVVNSDEKYSIAVEVTAGFTGATIPTITPNVSHHSVGCSPFSGTAVAGANTVKVTETGVGYTAHVPELPVYYACSNVGNTHDSKGVAKPSTKVEAKNLSADAPTNSVSATLTGVYAIYSTGTLYSGGFKTSAQDAAAYNAQANFEKYACATSGDNAYVPVRMPLTELTNGSTAFYGYFGFGSDNNLTNKIIYLPAGWKITEAFQPNASVSAKWDISCSYKQDGEAFSFTNKSGATSSYTKWVITGFTAVDSVRVKIAKQ